MCKRNLNFNQNTQSQTSTKIMKTKGCAERKTFFLEGANEMIQQRRRPKGDKVKKSNGTNYEE